jgi:hypothetical protein
VSARRTGLLTARALLDEALVSLRGLADPRLPVVAIEGCLEGALARTYQALEADEFERHQALAREALDLAREALFFFQDRELRNPALTAPLGLVAQSIGVLIEAGRAPGGGMRVTPERPVDAAWLRASFDEPRRLDLDRGVLGVVALIPRPERDPIEIEAVPPEEEPAVDDPVPPVDLDALLAEAERDDDAPPPPVAPPPPPVAAPSPTAALDAADERTAFGEALPAQTVLLAHARAFFEDLGMMGLMRRPDAGDLWHEMLPIEQRLLARLDAILAAGTWVLAELTASLRERPLPDPELLWAALFLYGSLGGEDALDQVVRLVRTAPLADEPVLDAVGDALAFAPDARLEDRLRPWLDDPSPALARVAVHALSRRRALSLAEVMTALASPRAAVVAEAARALVLVPGPVDPATLAWALRHPDPAVRSAAWTAALVHDRPTAVAHALAALRVAPDGEAALALALGGGADDMDALRELARLAPSPALTEAVGWAGLVDLVPHLLDRLDAGDPRALAALQRVTGASLTEAQPAHDPGAPLPFTRDDLMPEAELVLLEDPAAWRAWWAEHGRRPDPRARWQHGHRWTLRDALWELAEGATSSRERTLAWAELSARTGARIPFDAREWVVRQRRQVGAWGEYVALRAAGAAAGTWDTGGAR